MSKLSLWINAISDSIRINRSLAIGERVKYCLPFLLAVSMFLFDFFCHGSVFSISSLASSLVLMVALLLMLPPDFEPAALSSVMTVVAVVLCSIPSIICLTGHGQGDHYAAVTCFVAPTLLFLQLYIRSRDRNSGINFLLRDVNILHNREDFLRVSHAALVALFAEIIMSADKIGGLLEVLACVAIAIFAIAQFLSIEIRARVGVAYCSPKVRRTEVRMTEQGLADGQNMSNKEKALFDRVEKYMQEFQPYLDDSFSLTELAGILYTNKSYLSRTINKYSGYNFCQYVNKYRIEYAKEMMKKDKRLKVLELAMASGFHSVASFNMAFKLHTNDTPSEYMRTIHLCDGY